MNRTKRILYKFFALTLVFTFLLSDVGVYAQTVQLPSPGSRLALSPTFAPPLLKGIKVYQNDPFRFDFIVDQGDATQTDQQLRTDSNRLIKYFLASLTVPEKDLWVNLSPYEKDRIVPEAFGQTEMGRDLLAQDYILKQITASVIYPEDKVGKEFWDKVYAEAQKRYGTTDVPVDTFNKVWIIPEKATVYENKDAAFVVESKLKVMLEEDYLALEKNAPVKEQSTPATNKLGSDIVREVVIPILEKEVNEGKNFAPLRQVYHSLILATWYKRKVKVSILGQAYVDHQKTAGIDIADKNEKEKIWQQYVEAFKKGAYNFIKEEYDPATQATIPRKYFSGGTDLAMKVFKTIQAGDLPVIPASRAKVVQIRTDLTNRLQMATRDRAMTVGNIIAQTLKTLVFAGKESKDERTIFVYPGATLNGFLTTLYNTNEFNIFRPTPNEFTMADVAFGYAQKNGVAVAFVTHSVGAKPFLAEMGKAQSEQLPIILFSGGHSYGENDLNHDGLHALTNPADEKSQRDHDLKMAQALGIDVFVLSKELLKNGSAKYLQRFRNRIQRAVAKRRSLFVQVEPGVAQQDVGTISIDKTTVKQVALDGNTKMALKKLAQEIFQKISEANHPTFHVGDGLPMRLAPLVEEISEKLGIVLTVTWAGKGVIREDLPTYAGPYIGELTTELPRTKDFVEKEADFVFRLGNRKIPTHFEEGVNSRLFPKNSFSLSADERFPQGEDLEFFLETLLELAKSSRLERKILPDLNPFHQLKADEISDILDEPIQRSTVQRVFGNFNLLHNNEPYSYVVDPGTTWFPALFMPTVGRGKVVSNWSYGELGVSAGQALGVSFATNEVPIALMGDGAFAQKGDGLLSDLVRLKRHIVYVVFNNEELMMGTPQMDFGLFEAVYQTRNVESAILKIAAAKGATSKEVKTNRELLDALQESVSVPGVHVIVVPVKNTHMDYPASLRVFAERVRANKHLPRVGEDLAMAGPKGGIDLDPAKIDLKMKNNSGEIIFNLDPAMLQRMQDAAGIAPIIIGVQNLSSLQEFLGVKQ